MDKNFKSGKVVHAGIVEYGFALELMENIVEIKKRKPWPEILLLLEHPPTITLGKRGMPEDVLLSDKELQASGISMHHVQRGGLATYHGPGQLVGYILLDLKKNSIRPSQLVEHIEMAIIHLLKCYGIAAEQNTRHRGVWVHNKKIASIGIAVRGGITFHGFALNCNPYMAHFNLINPCGFKPGIMTSMTQRLNTAITPGNVKKELGHCIEDQMGIVFNAYPLKRLLIDVYTELRTEKSSWHRSDFNTFNFTARP